MTTITGIGMVAASAGAVFGGVVHQIWVVVVIFAAVNAAAALSAARIRVLPRLRPSGR
jgi:hypothetical protein